MLRYATVTRLLRKPAATSMQRAYSNGTNKEGSGADGQEDNHPIRRTLRLLGNDMRRVKEFFVPKDPLPEDDNPKEALAQSKFKFKGQEGPADEFQTHCDVLVVGGGTMGSSIAYWLKEKARNGLNVVVVEKDDTYAKSSTHVSVGALSQQFSLPENIQMSLFGADFLRNSGEYFGEDIPMGYTPHGQLTLANEADAAILKQSSQLQNELGARNELLSPERLASRFPWLRTKDVALGCLSVEREGWFDSWALLANLRRAASGYGAHFVHGELKSFEFQSQADIIVTGEGGANAGGYESLDKAVIQLPDGTERSLKFALCIIAAGVGSSDVARLAHIGMGRGMLQVPLPIAPRKRFLYALNTQAEEAPSLGMPMLVDTNGSFIRRDGLGGQYIYGYNAEHAEAADNELAYFESKLRPALAERLPVFAAAEVAGSMSGLYDYNVYDENGIVGPHPYYHNLYIASGFGGQGVQQAPAVGRAISELIIDGQFRTLDLSRLSFDRLIVDKPMFEYNALN
ncbi:FAD-dependent oxidoreductase domain-containing protein 1 [Drosophila busckii]|uniref:FAD-dependent oxidoreductase domain-containing protein 1 n=1 Tax=Drosophila busckii TaxID=30019 RepID=UPI001432FFF7|nr:FAD-dependent oxidoreductase domain-containing protein 1 [Drosophila busckii]